MFEKKPVHIRQSEAMIYLGNNIQIYRIDMDDHELIDHLLINHKILTAYHSDGYHKIDMIMERLV